MVGFYCYVPNCKFRKTAYLRKNKQMGEKNPSMFRPGDIKTLEDWKKVVPNASREITLNNFVCELHFEEKYIVRYFEQKLKDGSVFKLEREKPYLVPGAVPSIFSNNLSLISKRIKSPVKCESLENDKKGKISSQTELVSSNKENLVEPLSEKQQPIPSDQITLDSSANVFSFKYMTENIQQIIKPSTTWSISFISAFDTKYVMCVKWIAYEPERRIIISDYLSVKVFLKDRELTNTNYKVNSLHDISRLLKAVHDYVLCAGIGDKEQSDCMSYVEASVFSPGRKSIWCKNCRVSRRKKYLSQRKPPKKQKCMQSQIYYQRLLCSEKKVSRLQQKVMLLKQRLKLYKDW